MNAEKKLVDAFKLTDCYRELKALVDEFDAAPPLDSRNVQFKDKLMHCLLKHGEKQEGKLLHVKSVGAMPNNRGGEGLLWERAQSRASKIKASGYSEAAIADNAVVVEDNPYSHGFAKYTVERCKSNGRYARYKLEEIKAATVGSMHATHGFVCVRDEVPSSYGNISLDGKISRAKGSTITSFSSRLPR